MWCYRKLLKAKGIDTVSNAEILTRAGEKRCSWQNIVKQRVEVIGHIMHEENLIKTIIEGYIEMRRGRPRLRLHCMKQINSD